MGQHEIDITGDLCPFTFVKTKLLAERMLPGETARVRLKGTEPLKNVPRSLQEHGHDVLLLEPECKSENDGVHILVFRKNDV